MLSLEKKSKFSNFGGTSKILNETPLGTNQVKVTQGGLFPLFPLNSQAQYLEMVM